MARDLKVKLKDLKVVSSFLIYLNEKDSNLKLIFCGLFSIIGGHGRAPGLYFLSCKGSTVINYNF